MTHLNFHTNISFPFGKCWKLNDLVGNFVSQFRSYQVWQVWLWVRLGPGSAFYSYQFILFFQRLFLQRMAHRCFEYSGPSQQHRYLIRMLHLFGRNFSHRDPERRGGFILCLGPHRTHVSPLHRRFELLRTSITHCGFRHCGFGGRIFGFIFAGNDGS